MRVILLIAVVLAGCDSDNDVVSVADLSVADMTVRGEFCGGGGTRCCSNEAAGQSCTTGDSCRYDVACPPGYLVCSAGVWVHEGPTSCDMALPPGD